MRRPLSQIFTILAIFFQIFTFADTPPQYPLIGSPPNGLSVTGRTISLGTASGSTTGALTSSDWSLFNGKQGSLTFTSPLINTTGTVTCNVASGSQAGCLASADWTAFNGKQSALTFTSPLVNTSGTITCNAASGSQAGCLGSSDWTTFNSKQAALTAGSANQIFGTNSGANGFESKAVTATAAGSIAIPSGQTIQTGDGSGTSPAITFASETNTGWIRNGTGDIIFVVDGIQAFEALKVSSQVNVAFGGAGNISSSTQNPFQVGGNYAGTMLVQYENNNTTGGAVGTAAGMTLQVLDGGGANNATNISNYAQSTTGYMNGGSELSATAFQDGLFIYNTNTSGWIAFGVNSESAAHETMRVNASNLTLNNGNSLVMDGSSSGALTQSVPSAVTSYAVTWPSAQGTGALTNNGSGVLSWTAGGSGTVTSVGLSVPAFLSISGSPITTSGTLAIGLSGTALPIANGGTAVTSVTTSPTASSFAGWDANKNLTAGRCIGGSQTITSTSSLTVGSGYLTIANCSSACTITMPVVSGLSVGDAFGVYNEGSGTVTVNSSGGNAIGATVTTGNTAKYIVILTSGTTASSWKSLGSVL